MVESSSSCNASEVGWPWAVPPSRLLSALSQAFSYPAEGLEATQVALRALVQGEKSQFEMPSGWIERIEDVLDSSGEFEDLTAEQLAYTRLFIGSLRMEAPPYASYYLEKDHIMNGQAAVEVTGIYNLFGIEIAPSEIAPADHLRYLLAFLSLMAQQWEETGEEVFRESYENFRDDYILSWIDQCQELVDDYAEQAYYPKLIALIVDVLRA